MPGCANAGAAKRSASNSVSAVVVAAASIGRRARANENARSGIALLPERAFSFALARLPMEAAATTTALTLLLALLFAAPAFAQPGMSGDQNTRTSFYARTEFEKQMQHEIVCTCGACGHA